MKTQTKAEFTDKGELIQKLDLGDLMLVTGMDKVNAVKAQETRQIHAKTGIQVNNG